MNYINVIKTNIGILTQHNISLSEAISQVAETTENTSFNQIFSANIFEEQSDCSLKLICCMRTIK